MAYVGLTNDNSHVTIDDNQCEVFCLIWLDANVDANDARNAEQRLRSIINYLKKFQDVKQCQKYIERSSQRDRLILIVSGRLGREIVPIINKLRQVISIYVYCMDKKSNEKWALEHSKVKAVVVDLDELITRIEEDHNIQKKVDEPLPIHIFTAGAGAGQSTMGVNGQFVFSQVLIDCLLRLKYSEADKTELINCCKNEYEGNHMELENLRQFQNEYKSDKVLWWYTKETFFYKSLNAALRKQNIHMIFLFREFISDIHRQLQKSQSNKILTVHRGQMITSEELEILKQSVDQLISINSFFSTSTNYSKALSFLKRSRASEGLERVLFEIKADPKMVTTKPFADVSKHSDYCDESEVLFMIGSIFRLESITRNDKQIWIIRMTLSSDEEHGLKEVLMYMKGQIESEETNLRTLGKVLWKMGKFDLAEQYFIRLLKELEPNDLLNGTLYEDLGELAALRGNYDMSVQWHKKALTLKNAKQVNNLKSMETLKHSTTLQSTTQSDDKSQDSSETKTSTTAADGIDTEQFKQWLKNYLKQNAAMLAQQQFSKMNCNPMSVENFCYILENQLPISNDEQQTLRGLVNLGFTFDDINSEESIKFFRSVQTERTILILSKTSMTNLAKPIRDEPLLSAIYVIDSSKENSFDSKLCRGSFPNITRLCKQLESDLSLLTYDLTSISSIPAEYTKISTLNYVQTLKDILLEVDEKRNLKQEMIDFCRAKYVDNVIQLKLIDEFEKTFQSRNAIHWYLRHETFLYKMITRAFRVLDPDILYNLRYFIQHLHRELESSTGTSPLTIYRTIRIRKDLLEKMKSYQDGLLSFNEYLLSSKKQSTIEPSLMNINSKLVHFQIDLGADISRHVVAIEPNVVLLTVGTIFHIDKVESIDEETFAVKLTTNGTILKAGQMISKDLRDAVRGPSPLVRMAKLMRQRELTNYMEYFGLILMDDPRTIADEATNLTLGGILHFLGGHYYERKQYEQALTHLQNALKVYQRVLPPDDIRLTPTYNNIGSIYHRQDLNEEALPYHQKAYEIQKNSTHPDMESVAAYVGNIASVLIKLGRHKEAIRYLEMDLKIQQKLNPNKDKPEIAAKYHNIAAMQYRTHLYSEALENYQKCLEIELKCHSTENPTVAVTYFNMGTAFDKLGRFQEAKEAVEKSIERLLQTKKEDDEDIQTKRKYVKQLEQKLWMKDLLATA